MSIFRVRLTQGNRYTGSGNLDAVARRSGTISAATNATPIVITSSGHGLTSGDKITIAGVAGNTAANSNTADSDPWTVTVLTADTFALNGVSGNGSYTSGGHWSAVSIQRTTYVPGADGTNRVLTDGEVFEDCNFWKQFTVDEVGVSQAFIEVVEDDGIPYLAGVATSLQVVYSLSVANDTTYADNEIDIEGDYGVPATSVVVSMTGATDVTMKINGSSNAIFPLTSGVPISDLGTISMLQFANGVSGGGTAATVSVLASVPSYCRS